MSCCRFLMVEVGSGSLNDKIAYYGNETRPGAHFPCNAELVSKIKNDTKASSYKDVIENWLLTVPSGHWSNWMVSVCLCEVSLYHKLSKCWTEYVELCATLQAEPKEDTAMNTEQSVAQRRDGLWTRQSGIDSWWRYSTLNRQIH
jgi:hypothetical protein